MKKDEYAYVAAELNALWPSSKWEVATIKAGEHLLLDLPAQAVLAAVRQLAAEGERFAPNPGQVRRRAVELTAPAIPSADEALAEVYEQMAKVGSYGTPEWSHPAIKAAVDAMGGWWGLCRSEDTMADRAHFLKIYGSVEHRHQNEQLVAPTVTELLKGLDLRLDRTQAAIGPGGNS